MKLEDEMANFSQLDKLLQSFVDGGLPGCALQIAQKGKTIYEGYFGYSDMETKAPITDKSIFRLASMSKIPLYTTMMILYERGKYLMTEPISNYFPEWKNTKKFVKDANGEIKVVPTDGQITIRDCMSMKCGLPYCNSMAKTENRTLRAMQECMKPLNEKGFYTNREHIAAMAEAPLAFEPGSHWVYGFSSELAAGLIEAIGAEPKEVLKSRDYMLVYESEADVLALKPNFEAIARIDTHAVIVTAKGDSSDFVSRFFAPEVGVPEDPVTGSAH
jgi:CubicO group peptidase (beta-lactamase class C family)